MLVSHSMAHLTRTLFSREIVIFVCLGCLRVDFTEVEGAAAFIKDTADLGIGKVSRHKRASGTLIPIPAEEREAGVLRHNEYRAKQQASNMEYMVRIILRDLSYRIKDLLFFVIFSYCVNHLTVSILVPCFFFNSNASLFCRRGIRNLREWRRNTFRNVCLSTVI